jgi:hypothetical protein
MLPHWMLPPLSFALGGGVVLAVGFVVGTALQPVAAPMVHGTSRDLPIERERFLVSQHFPGALDVSPGSVWNMIEYMHRSEMEIATQRLEVERGERDLAP